MSTVPADFSQLLRGHTSLEFSATGTTGKPVDSYKANTPISYGFLALVHLRPEEYQQRAPLFNQFNSHHAFSAALEDHPPDQPECTLF